MTKNMKQNNNKNKKHIKIKNKKDKSFKKKLKHEPGLKKTGNFTVSEGHRYPLVLTKCVTQWPCHSCNIDNGYWMVNWS
jgi:hypothetical protein